MCVKINSRKSHLVWRLDHWFWSFQAWILVEFWPISQDPALSLEPFPGNPTSHRLANPVTGEVQLAGKGFLVSAVSQPEIQSGIFRSLFSHCNSRFCCVTCQIVFVFSLITYCNRNKTNYLDHYFDYIEANKRWQEASSEGTHVRTKSSKLILLVVVVTPKL